MAQRGLTSSERNSFCEVGGSTSFGRWFQTAVVTESGQGQELKLSLLSCPSQHRSLFLFPDIARDLWYLRDALMSSFVYLVQRPHFQCIGAGDLDFSFCLYIRLN